MIKCAIIEDQPPAQRLLRKYVEDHGGLELLGVFDDPLKAMNLLTSNELDLLFLDIHLPKISGVDFLKSLAHPPKVILTTAFAEYALEGYELNVVDYLMKPFSFQRFIKAVAKVQDSPQTKVASASETNKEVFAKIGHEHVKLATKDILYLMSDLDYTEIHLEGRKYVTSESLKAWQEVCGPDRFIRVHRSYLVNIDKVERLSSSKLHLSTGHEIPIGRAFRTQALDNILKGRS